MKTLLLTGFEAFAGHTINPSEQAALALDGLILDGLTLDELTLDGLTLGSARVVSGLLPVDAEAASGALDALIARHHPDGVLLVGLAAGRPQLSLERVAVNVQDFRIPDNAGRTVQDLAVHHGGPDAHLSTLPLRAILAGWAAAGLPGYLSATAGLYLCNAVMYHARQVLGSGVPCGFLHVPANAEIALVPRPDRPPLPYLPQAEITRGVRVALEVLAATLVGTDELAESR